MNIMNMVMQLIDNGGRRTGIERRQFSYTNHIPEMRSGGDRRGNGDRRSGLDKRSGKDRRIVQVIEVESGDNRGRRDRRSGKDRRAAFAAATL